MNVPAAFVAAGFGVVFLAVGSHVYNHPALFDDIDYAAFDIFTTDNAKARAAVSRLLFNPASAEFRDLRPVKVDAAKFVCGDVKARDKEGHYPGFRAFVYTVDIDFARIDDDGRIAQRHDTFRACPVIEEEGTGPDQLALPPGVQAMAKTIQKVIPPINRSTELAAASKASGAAGGFSGATMDQQLRQFAGRTTPAQGPGAAGGSAAMGQQHAAAPFKATPDNEAEWRSDRPPTAWPAYPDGHPLAKPIQKRSAAQTLAMARDIEHRWEQSKSGNPGVRPSPDEIKEVCHALLAIESKSEEFPRAWAAFVRLRKIDRAAN